MIIRRRWIGIALSALAASFVLSPTAQAHDMVLEMDGFVHGHVQKVEAAGQLPSSSKNVRMVSKLQLGDVGKGRVADVGVHKGFAYLARFRPDAQTCSVGLANGGVWVVDIRDPAKPKEAGFIPLDPGAFPGEGVQTIHLKTPSFTGDVLIVNAETCAQGTKGGMTMYDVTDPYKPVPLATHFGDVTAEERILPEGQTSRIHSVFAWQDGAKAYAVMVDNDEEADVDIVDITDPRSPAIIAEYQLDEIFPQILQPDLGTEQTFHHDVIVKRIKGRQIMLVSYWDGGYVKLDMTDPRKPVYLADTDFAATDVLLQERTGAKEKSEGNAHQAEFGDNDQWILAADEDFSPTQGRVRRTDTGAVLTAAPGSGTPQLSPSDPPLTGVSRYVGLACPSSDLAATVPPGDGTQIALVQRGICTFTQKVAAVEAAGGYIGIMIFNREGADACDVSGGMSVEGGLPTFGTMPRSQAFGLFGATLDPAACAAGTGGTPMTVGAVGAPVAIQTYFDGWGYVRLFDNGTGKLKELDQYAVPQAHDPRFSTGAGDLSVHEVATSSADKDRAYLSYYAAGVRVVTVDRGKIKEVGHFIDEGGSNFWGVQTFKSGGKELVAASDMDYGLYIFEYTGKE